MAGSIIAFLFPSVPAVFSSDYPLVESAERLRTAASGSFTRQFTRPAMRGSVSEERVRLTRVLPLVANPYCPRFFGSFRETEGAVVLSGRFAMSELAKGFMSFWLALAVLFAVLITLGMVIGVALGQVPHWWEPPVALVFAWGFVALGVGFLKLTHWFARNDVAWLSKTITEVLTASDKLPPPEVQATGRLHKSFLDLAGQ